MLPPLIDSCGTTDDADGSRIRGTRPIPRRRTTVRAHGITWRDTTRRGHASANGIETNPYTSWTCRARAPRARTTRGTCAVRPRLAWRPLLVRIRQCRQRIFPDHFDPHDFSHRLRHGWRPRQLR